MYRVAVIQNGIEMQHSGYVDSIPMYKKFGCIGREKAEFTRFSGVNIRDLFAQGDKYLLDYDALILGTNATSDDDVYNVLRENNNKIILHKFIEIGKGLLICSQKKYQPRETHIDVPEYKLSIDAKNDDFLRILENTGKGNLYCQLEKIIKSEESKQRISGFMPTRYEYIIDERKTGEGSNQEGATLVPEDRCTLSQKCLISLPNVITNDLIKRHCCNNPFQTHYYRDIIFPIYNSAYQPLIIDQKGDITRNLLMVAVPQNKERIVISTMAMDWAKHEELLENIIYYLTRGVPHVAFVHKNNYDNSEMKILTLEAELSKVGNIEYRTIDEFLKNIQWHSLVIFSPGYSEEEVSKVWQKIKKVNLFTKAYHYRTVGEELVLEKYSSNTYIEQQKMDVLAWLNSKRGKRLWDNSLWKTYDVAKLLNTIDKEKSPAILNQIVEAIIQKDDKNKSHYRVDGSYDGVLAPTCGMLEILYWANDNIHYSVTRDYLLERYEESKDVHNKMFILRSLWHCNDMICQKYIDDVILNTSISLTDMIDLDVCLNAEIAIILYEYSKEGKNINKQWLEKSLNELCRRQSQNGKWDNLSNTAIILVFLLQYKEIYEKILFDQSHSETLKMLNSCIDRGITAVKSAYSVSNFNWENNIVTTANSLLALFLYDENSEYKSKDFLKHFIDDSISASNYNALNIALNTLDKTIDDVNKLANDLYVKNELIKEYEENNKTVEKRLYFVSSLSGFGVFGLLSVFFWLYLKYAEVLKDILGEVFMWIPIAIGMIITPIVMSFIKKISSFTLKQKKAKDKTKD